MKGLDIFRTSIFFKWVQYAALLLPVFLVAESDFDVLMGKETKHWQFVSQPCDIALLDLAKQLYDTYKQDQFTQEGPYKIPQVVHFVWLGPKHFPPESVDNMRTWIAQHPQWTVKLWTDRSRPAPCNGIQIIDVSNFSFVKLKRQYDESENWAEKSDILRYEILFQEGGVYVDHDVSCLKPFDGMHRGYHFYCALEPPHEPFVGRNVTCGNAVIGSRPHHPTMEAVIDHIAHKWDVLKKQFPGRDPYSKIEIVMQRTYIPLTECLAATIRRQGNMDIVFPSGYFCAKSGIPSLYSKHFYVTSWDEYRQKKSEYERNCEKIVHKLLHDSRSLMHKLFIIIGFNLALIAILTRYILNARKRES